MNMKASMLFSLILLGLSVPCASAENPKSYIGKSDCIRELNSPMNRYGVRLDKAQKAYLIVYQFKDSEIVTIVQYQAENGSDGKRCGVIRDVTQLQDKDSSVVWGCSDRRAPTDVVIGTWPARHSKPLGAASEAWRVDLKELKFIPLDKARQFVYCHPEDGRGNDEGDGLSDWAKKQAGKHRPH